MIESASAPAADSCVELLRALHQVAAARRRTLTQKNAVDLMVLSTLADCAEGMRISDLAEQLMLDVSAASRRVAALRSAGLLDHITDTADHRAQRVRMTVEGRSVLSDAASAAGTDLAARLPSWTVADIQLMTELTRRLARDLTAGAVSCRRPGARVRPVGLTPD